MRLLSRFTTDHLTVDAATAERLRHPATAGPTIAIQPPRADSVPATLPEVFQSLRETRTGLLGLGNRSPVIAYELRRQTTDTLRLQVSVPTNRLERTVRTQLQSRLPAIGFAPGSDGLPVAEGTAVAGATLSPAKAAYYPLRTEFPVPPMTHIAAALHRHAMQETEVVLQVLAQPIAGQPVRNWLHRLQGGKQMDYLTKEKEQLWGTRSPTQLEREQARQIEQKITQPQWRTSIRVLVMRPTEAYLASRIQEVANTVRIFERAASGQRLSTRHIEPLRTSELTRFVESVADRRFGTSSDAFRTSTAELAAVLSIPSRGQENLQHAPP